MSEYEEERSQTQDYPEEVEKFAHEAEESTSQFNHNEPTAPPPTNDDNGYIVVSSQQQQQQQQQNSDEDSARSPAEETKPKTAAESTSCGSFRACPYYFLGINCLSKVHIPPKVKELVLWQNPKLSGAVFGSSLVLLLSLATFTLLSVVSTLLLLALTTVGAYRFYLSLLFRIKGTYDDTFDKLSTTDFSLPKDKVQELARLLDNDLNRFVNQVKSIILWDNLATSSIAFFVTYLVYCVGSWFNTITLLILALVGLFSLPKVYQVYQVQIDQAIEQATAFAHKTADDIMAKLPFLKKKVQ